MAVSLFVAGDVVPKDRTIPFFKRKDVKYLFNDLIPIINRCDIKIVNFESPIIDSQPTPIKKSGPCLYTGKETAEVLKAAGFNVFTLANNHFRDQGENGVFSTLNTCDSLGIQYVGGGRNITEARNILYIEVNKTKVAVINACESEFSIATESSGGGNPIDLVTMYEDIIEARTNADYVIVILHGGIEHYIYPTPRMKKYYRHFIHIGADVVINHHQHCFSGYEIYEGKPIFYGLGNFCFDRDDERDSIWNKGFGLILELDKKSINFRVIPYRQCDEEPRLTLCPESEYVNDIKKINLVIQDDYLLEQKLNEHVLKNESYILSGLLPTDNRYIQALYCRGYMGRLYTDRNLLRMKNMLWCESHYDTLKQLLSIFAK